MSANLTKIIMSVVLVSLVVSGIGIYVFGLGSKYDISTSELEDDFVKKFKAEAERTTDRLDSAREEISSVEEDKGVLDRLASFFRSGYDTALTMIDSFTSISRMINLTIQNIPFLGGFTGQVTTAIITIVLIIIVIGIFLHFLIKSERI